MALKEYRRKRDFARTPEPAGGKRPKLSRGALRYVIQKHAASRLHYDFRLEWEGTLKSWAVPKGPSLDPADKRLAVEVEDHPIEYGTFEGTIPKGQYGGGTVLLWDRGTWEPLEDPDFRKGRLKFRLDGEKLHGKWALVRMAPRPGDTKPNWLLIKDKDEFARRTGDITEERPESVATGKSLEDIGAEKNGKTWQSNKPPKLAKLSKPKARLAALADQARVNGKAKPLRVPAGARKASLPASVDAELATLVTSIPEGDGWLFEIKFDGYRILARVKGGKVQLLSRNHKDWTDRFEPIADQLAKLGHDALIDGELVALQPDGTTDFQALQNSLKRGKTEHLVYYAFDLLHLDGADLTSLPLTERKEVLRSVVDRLGKQDLVRFSDHVVGQGAKVLDQACRMALEGVIAKRADAPYRGGRGKDWLKLKCIENQEFVIGGWTDPAGSRKGLGALLLGVYDDQKQLQFAGKVGTGFTDDSLADLAKRLGKLEVERAPFSARPPGVLKSMHWVLPKLVAEVDFTEWTRDGHLRHPSFRGLREDKPATAVVRERRQAPPPAKDGTPGKEKRNGAPPRPVAQRTGTGTATVEGVRISHPDRVIYPKLGITKLALAQYYASVAERMLPHVVDRPLMLLRCPQGQAGQGFFQKNAGVSIPKGIAPVKIPNEKGGPASTYLRIETAQGVVGLVQLGVIEIHIWGSRAQQLEKPDRIVFDLDPDPTVPWERVVEGALRVKKELERRGLKTFLKTTGGKGLHVVAPIEPVAPWAAVKEATRQIAVAIVKDDPKGFTAQLSKARRTGKIFLDYLRNGRGATWIAPYAARAREGAGVSMPLAWSALKSTDPGDFTVATVSGDRLGADPWKDIAKAKQTLVSARR